MKIYLHKLNKKKGLFSKRKAVYLYVLINNNGIEIFRSQDYETARACLISVTRLVFYLRRYQITIVTPDGEEMSKP